MNFGSILLLLFVVMLPCGVVVGLVGAYIRHYLLENHPLMTSPKVEVVVNVSMLVMSGFVVLALYLIFN